MRSGQMAAVLVAAPILGSAGSLPAQDLTHKEIGEFRETRLLLISRISRISLISL